MLDGGLAIQTQPVLIFVFLLAKNLTLINQFLPSSVPNGKKCLNPVKSSQDLTKQIDCQIFRFFQFQFTKFYTINDSFLFYVQVNIAKTAGNVSNFLFLLERGKSNYYGLHNYLVFFCLNIKIKTLGIPYFPVLLP